MNWGIPDKKVVISLILEMKQLRNSKVRDLIDAINKGLKNVRSIKNTVAHHDNYSDKKLIEIASTSMIIQNIEKEKLPKGSDIFLKIKTSFYKQDKLNEIRKNNEEICKAIWYLFDFLYPEIKKRLEHYERLTSQPR